LEAIQGYDGKVEAIVYLPDTNKTTDDFLLVMNRFSPYTRKSLLEPIPFEALGLLVNDKGLKEEEQQLLLVPNNSVLKRQISYVDFGFTGGRRTSRKGQEDGISAPILKPGTDQPVVKQTFEALSKVLQHLDFPFCKNPQVDKKHSKRNSKFAATISPQNRLEALRINQTTASSKCNSHSDKLNNPLLSLVRSIHRFIVIHGILYRLAITGYSRKSVGDFLLRLDTFGAAIEFICHEFAAMDSGQNILSSDVLLMGTTFNGLQGFCTVLTKCNMDPWLYYSPVIHFPLLLLQKFGLSYPELMSVMVAYTKMPFSTYYFATAAKALLLLSSDDELITSCQSFRFGLYLFQLMVAFRNEMDKQKNNIPIRWGVDGPERRIVGWPPVRHLAVG
jgi:hypothetical protein